MFTPASSTLFLKIHPGLFVPFLFKDFPSVCLSSCFVLFIFLYLKKYDTFGLYSHSYFLTKTRSFCFDIIRYLWSNLKVFLLASSHPFILFILWHVPSSGKTCTANTHLQEFHFKTQNRSRLQHLFSRLVSELQR